MVLSPIYFVHDNHYLSVEDYMLPDPVDCFFCQVVVRVSNRGLQLLITHISLRFCFAQHAYLHYKLRSAMDKVTTTPHLT